MSAVQFALYCIIADLYLCWFVSLLFYIFAVLWFVLLGWSSTLWRDAADTSVHQQDRRTEDHTGLSLTFHCHIICICYFVWLSDSGIQHVKKVAVRCAELVLGWVTICRYTMLVFNQPPRSTQPGHPSVGRHNKYWRWSRPLLGKKWRVKPGFHYPSWWPELTGDRFPLPVNTDRIDGCAFPLAELTGR